MAAPRTSAEPPNDLERTRRRGLSVQTLIIASVSSAVAAVVVARLWDKGTIIASAMTPVVVALVSEALSRPMESERVRAPMRAVASGVRPRSGRTPTVIKPPAPPAEQPGEGIEPGPVRVYGGSGGAEGLRGPGGRRRLKLALVTGLVGFLLAAAALTLPELIFGGSVARGDRGTTYFGGGSGSSAGESDQRDSEKDEAEPSLPTDEQQTQPGDETTAPDETSESIPPPQDETPPPTQETQPPTTAPPTTTVPAPTTPQAPTP